MDEVREAVDGVRLSRIRETFRARAAAYDGEAPWNVDTSLAEMLLLTAGSKSSVMLDVCAGTGLVSNVAARLGWRTVAVDATYEMLSRAEIPHRVLGLAESLPFRDRSFDLAVCRQGMQYLHLDIAIAEMIRVAPLIGLIHIFSPCADDNQFWRRYFEVASPGRLHVFNEGSLDEICLEKGLKAVWAADMTTRSPVRSAVNHLTEARKQVIDDMFRSMDATMVDRYQVRHEGHSITYEQHWRAALFA